MPLTGGVIRSLAALFAHWRRYPLTGGVIRSLAALFAHWQRYPLTGGVIHSLAALSAHWQRYPLTGGVIHSLAALSTHWRRYPLTGGVIRSLAALSAHWRRYPVTHESPKYLSNPSPQVVAACIQTRNLRLPCSSSKYQLGVDAPFRSGSIANYNTDYGAWCRARQSTSDRSESVNGEHVSAQRPTDRECWPCCELSYGLLAVSILLTSTHCLLRH